MPQLIKVRVTLKGKPVGSYTFDKPNVVIGRDPSCDICIDNIGISREHARIDRTEAGFFIQDLTSSNGTFLNNQVIERDLLQDEDRIQIGKFALWIGLEGDRRDAPLLPRSATVESFQGTTILSTDQMRDLQRKTRSHEQAQARSDAEKASGSDFGSRVQSASALFATFLFGLLSGIVLSLFLQG